MSNVSLTLDVIKHDIQKELGYQYQMYFDAIKAAAAGNSPVQDRKRNVKAALDAIVSIEAIEKAMKIVDSYDTGLSDD